MPTLPIEVRVSWTHFYDWSVNEDGDDYIFQPHDPSNKELPDPYPTKECPGTEYLEALLAVQTPEELVRFMNRYSCPLRKL